MKQRQMRLKPLRQRVMKMILKKSPVGKNTFSILVQAYSKCKPLMCKVHVIHCFSAARIEIL